MATLAHYLEIGPFAVGLMPSMKAMLDGISESYPGQLAPYQGQLVDFELSVRSPSWLRRIVRPSAQFYWNEQAPFHPLPAQQAPLAFEWGLNFAIAKSANQFIILHSAVLAKDGNAVIMPAPPGSGKSTLTAALMLSGWQLLSDEFALFDPATGLLSPLPRPISLKNRSIDIIQAYAPERAVLSQRFHGTKKGDISLLLPDEKSRRSVAQKARMRWVLFPRWQENAGTEIQSFSKGQSLMVLADNAFNLGLHGEKGFNVMCDLLEQADVYQLTYSKLAEGVTALEELSQAC